MSNFSSFSLGSSDSGTFLLDPEERALLRAYAERSAREEDEAEAHRHFLRAARELPAVRLEKVLRLRRQIAEGTYDLADRMEETAQRMLQRLQGEDRSV